MLYVANGYEFSTKHAAFAYARQLASATGLAVNIETQSASGQRRTVATVGA